MGSLVQKDIVGYSFHEDSYVLIEGNREALKEVNSILSHP